MPTLKTVQNLIKSQNMTWEAGSTPIGQLFESGTFKGFGYNPFKKEPNGGPQKKRRLPTFSHGVGDLPKALDWRARDGDTDQNFVTGVRDQSDCGACVAFATCAVLESRRKIQANDAFAFNNSHLSVSNLFFCGNTSRDACDDGWITGAALKHCQNHGVGMEKDHPYSKKYRFCKVINPVVWVKNWKRIVESDKRKQALFKNGPVIGGMYVFSDFGWYKSGVYRPTTTEIAGLHAVAIIGYDDDLGCWIIKNSWGPAWGEGGFARIGYGACGIDTQFPFYDVELRPPS